jgi:membrane-bound ClpP family serine protease
MAITSALPDQTQDTAERQWFIVGRWQEVEGEARANLLRIVAIGVFYSIELIASSGYAPTWLQLGPAVAPQAHQVITAVAVAWTLLALGVHVLLREQIFPPALKYITTAGDILLLTLILMVAYGPRSAMVVGYFLIIVLSGLRFQLRLVWCATVGTLAAYLFLLGYAKWFAPAASRSEMLVPRYHQLVMLTALALTGIMLGQILRRVKSLAADYAARLDRAKVPG